MRVPGLPEHVQPVTDEPERTRLQEIALEYVERYWTRLHSEDRLAIVREALTPQERQALRQER